MSDVTWSGLRQTYRVQLVDGRVEDVKVGIPDCLRWEANNNGRSVTANLGLTTILTVVWYAMRRLHLSEETDFGVFAASVEDFGVVDTTRVDELPDPTKPGQSDG